MHLSLYFSSTMQISIGPNRVAVATMASAIATTIAFLPLAMPTSASESTLAEELGRDRVIHLAQWIQPDTGSSSVGSYRNEYFDFSISFPNEWAIASQETQDQVMDLGTEIVSESNPELIAAAAESLENTYQLLMLSADSFNRSELAFNPSLIIMAENIVEAPHIASGADYLAEHQAILSQTDLPYQMIGTPYSVDLDGHTFYRSDYQLNSVIKQSYLVTIDQGYAVGFILTGLPEQFSSLETIVASTDFDAP